MSNCGNPECTCNGTNCNCGNGECCCCENEKITNGDVVRMMSDEEIAQAVCGLCAKAFPRDFTEDRRAKLYLRVKSWLAEEVSLD